MMLSLEVELSKDGPEELESWMASFWKASVTWVPLLPNNYIFTFHVHVSNMMNL